VSAEKLPTFVKRSSIHLVLTLTERLGALLLHEPTILRLGWPGDQHHCNPPPCSIFLTHLVSSAQLSHKVFQSPIFVTSKYMTPKPYSVSYSSPAVVRDGSMSDNVCLDPLA
jgi:hypothetical protein